MSLSPRPFRAEGAGAAAPAMAVFVGSWLPYSETFIHSQLRQLRGMRASVIAGARTEHANRFPYPRVLHLPWYERLGYRYAGVAPSVGKALDRSGACLAFAHFGLNGAFALPFVRRRGLPLVVMFHGHDVGGLLPANRNHPRYFRYQRLAPELFDYASMLLCASAELRDTLLECGAPAGKLHVHRLGIDLDRFGGERIASERRRVLMVGRLVEKKGIAYGLRALAAVARRFPDVELRIVGDGPDRGALIREVARLSLQRRVTFVGSLPHLGVVEEMRRAYLMLTPSVTTARGDRESGVLVLKEAGALGVPAVATRHGGIPEIIEPGVTGILVPQRSVEELAGALEALLGDSALAEQMGKRARNKIRAEYDDRKQMARLEELLMRAAGRSVASPPFGVATSRLSESV